MYLAGAGPQFGENRPLKELDPGAEAWQSEAWLLIEHDALLIDHRIPLWDPYDGYGAPFAASAQPQPLYPLTILAALHPSPRMWSWYVVARLFVAAFFAALFVRFYGGRFAALAAGLVSAFAGYYLLYYGVPHLSVETLLPAALWSTEWLIRRPGAAPVAALGAVAGCIYLGGMPESAAVVLLATSLYFAVRNLGREPIPWPYARVAAFAAANVLGIAIGAVMLLPFIEYLPYAIDTHRTAPIGLGYDGLSLGRTIFQKLVPLAYGPPLNTITDIAGNGYSGVRGWFGATTAVFAIAALFNALRRRGPLPTSQGPVLALCVVFVCALGKSMGAPWINWIGALPVLRLIGFTKYDEVVIDVSAALLCGFGIALFERGRMPDRWILPASIGTVAVALFLGYSRALTVAPPTEHAIFLYGSTAFAVALLILIVVVERVPRAAPHAAAILCGLVILDAIGNYYAPMYGHVATIPPVTRNPYAGAPFVAALRAADRSGLRVMGTGGPLWPNWAGAMRLDDPEALNGMYPAHYIPFLNAFLQDRAADSRDLLDRFDSSGNPSLVTAGARRWMTLSSVGYLVLRADQSLSDPHLRLIYDRDVRIYAYDAPLPRASIFHRATWVPAASALDALADPRTDVTQTIVLTGNAPDNPPPVPNAPAAAESARIVERGVAGATIEADLHGPGYVMLNDTWYPGWEARVDGVAQPILEADYLFRAVRVDGGHHRIEYAYRPASAEIGMALTALGILAAAGLGVLSRRRSRRIVAA